ncbi:WG repeat-containing protein [Treponema sp. OMZ 840]|uniref:WG repeat-containing protein n=1 Tax=Treponema sp. OMZ 840 TaxID=244313 RepID=UPI003D8B76C7
MEEQGDFVSGLFNENKKVVFCSKDYYVKTDFSDGYALIGQTYDPEKDEPLFCSVVDVSGKTIFQYRDSGPVYRIHISEQMFQYMLYDKDTEIDEHGFYDIHGNKAVYCDRRAAYFSGGFHEGYVVYHDLKKHKAFFMDKHGTFLKERFNFPVSADILNRFSEGYAVFGEKHGNPDLHTRSMSLWGIMDKKGRKLLSAKYAYLGECVINGFIPAASVYYDNEEELTAATGLIDVAGNWKIKPKYYEVKNYSGSVCAVRYIPVSADRKVRNAFGYRASGWKLIDIRDNDVFILPQDYTLDGDFNDGHIIYGKPVGERQWKWGLMNERGEFATQPVFDKILYSSCGYWIVLYNDEYMLYSDKDGLVRPKEYLDFSKIP